MSDEDKNPERDMSPGPSRPDGVPHANGHAAVEQMAPTAPSPQTNAAQQVLVSHCQALLETIIFGTITKFQGVTPNVIAISTCRALGVIVGTIFHGSLSDVLTIRRQCREAFLQGLASAPAPQLAPGSAPYVPPVPDYKKVNRQ